MTRLLTSVAFLWAFLSTLISAQCAACDSYTSALQSCQTTSANVTAVGTTMDSTTIHCMCTSKSGVTEMNACQGCEDTNPGTSLVDSVLAAWTLTCTADDQFGDQQAASCWEGQPDNVGPCLSQTGKSGSVGGGDAVTSKSSQPATTSPTATAKSSAMLSLEAPVLVLVLIVGLGMAIEL